MISAFALSLEKARTIISLASSAVIFIVYFGAAGFALTEMGVPLTTYLASASLIGLAVAFGSQGLVQDVVSGLTIVFTDLYDIDDLVEINGQVGIVEQLGMRFTVIRNPMGAVVFVPNRSIGNVIAYQRGYIRCLVDIILPNDIETSAALKKSIFPLVESAADQYPGVLRAPPEVTGPYDTKAGRSYMRIKFRIWPGRGGPIEGPFKENLLQVARLIAPEYQNWMISVNYEVEAYQRP